MFSVCSRVVFDEAEAAGRLLDLVQPHDDALDVAALGEELLDLLLGGVERQVAHVQRGGDLQELLLQLLATLRAQRAVSGLKKVQSACGTGL